MCQNVPHPPDRRPHRGLVRRSVSRLGGQCCAREASRRGVMEGFLCIRDGPFKVRAGAPTPRLAAAPCAAVAPPSAATLVCEVGVAGGRPRCLTCRAPLYRCFVPLPRARVVVATASPAHAAALALHCACGAYCVVADVCRRGRSAGSSSTTANCGTFLSAEGSERARCGAACVRACASVRCKSCAAVCLSPALLSVCGRSSSSHPDFRSPHESKWTSRMRA
jgi:hypothetical protein